jgi:YegS/Rv2252/BmrU family lipid kinase
LAISAVKLFLEAIPEHALIYNPLSPTMRKAILLYNPSSGGRRDHRESDVESAATVLRTAGVEITKLATEPHGDAADQAKEAIAKGYDTVIACGGDGTVHDILQGVAGTHVPLGIIPLGTANALAHDLKLPLNAVKAANALLHARPRRVTLGHVTYRDFSGTLNMRYFIVAAGIGVDAHLFYKLNAGVKKSLGMLSYYAKATHLWLTDPFTRFAADFLPTGYNQSQRSAVSELLAVRINNFGGVLQELAPGASLERNDLRLVLFRTTSRLMYLLYIIRGLLRERFPVYGIDLVHAEQVACDYLPSPTPVRKNGHPPTNLRIFVEVDGELVGTLPAKISSATEAVSLLVP